jgi:hypothetical protein
MSQQLPGVETTSWDSDSWGNIYTGEVNVPPPPPPPVPQPKDQVPSYLDIIEQAARHGVTINPSDLAGY